MKRYVLITEILFLISVLLFLLPIQTRQGGSPVLAVLVVLGLLEIIYIVGAIRRYQKEQSDINTFSIIYGIIFGIFLIWQLLTADLDVVNPVLFPSPQDVFYVYVEEWKLILTGLLQSLLKLAIGISLGLVIGTFIGLIIGWIPSMRMVFFPICKVLSPIPPIVYVSYIVALMPTFASASVAVIFLGVFWPTLLSTITSIGNIDEGIIISAKSMMVKDVTMMFKVILPYTLPGILSGMTMMVTFSFMTLTSAEMIGSTAGLGYFVTKYANYAMYDNVLCGIITIGIVVTVLNRGLEVLRAKVIKWK